MSRRELVNNNNNNNNTNNNTTNYPSRRERSTNPFDDDFLEDDNLAEGATNRNGNGIRSEPRADNSTSVQVAFSPEDDKDERRQKYRKTRQGRSAPLVFSNPFQDNNVNNALPASPTPHRNHNHNTTAAAAAAAHHHYTYESSASSEISPLLPDDLSRGYQSGSSFSPSLRSGKSRRRRRKITVPTRIFTGREAATAEAASALASPYGARTTTATKGFRSPTLSDHRRVGKHHHGRGGQYEQGAADAVVLRELAHIDEHEHHNHNYTHNDNHHHNHNHNHNQPEQFQMEYKYILLEDLGTAASWVILVLPYATFFFSVVLVYFISVPVASMGSLVTALRMSCFLVTLTFIFFWIRQMEMLRLCFGDCCTGACTAGCGGKSLLGRLCDRMRRFLCCCHGETGGERVDANAENDDDDDDDNQHNPSEEMHWWENPWVLFPERYYVLPLLLSSLLVLEPILVLIYFVPTMGTPIWYTVANASSGAGIQACAFLYLCLIQGFRYHTGERSKRRAELQRKALQLRKAIKFVEQSRNETNYHEHEHEHEHGHEHGHDHHRDRRRHVSSSPKVVQSYYDKYGDIDGSGFTEHLRLPNDPRADGWADFLLPKMLLLAVGIASATMISLSMTPVDESISNSSSNSNSNSNANSNTNSNSSSDNGFVTKGTLFIVGSIVYAMTLSVWTVLTIAALYTTGEKLKKEPFLGTRPAQLAYRILFAHSGLAIVGLAIASMQYVDQIRWALRHQSIASIIEQEHSSLVYPGYISFPGMFGRLVCVTAQVAITAFIFLPPHTMDFEEDSDDHDENELTELQMRNKNRRDKRLVVRLARESKTWRIFPCPIQTDDDPTSSPFQDNMFQVYKDLHTERHSHQRGLVSVGPYIPVFCAETACWLNEAAAQAYNSPAESSSPSSASSVRRDFGNNFDRDDFVGWMRLDLIGLQLEGYVYDERTNTLAYIATNSAPQVDGDEDSVIVVSFRGTSDATNVKTDFRVQQVPLHDQITGIGESAFRVFPDRFEICDADGWIWDTKTTRSDDRKEFVRCVDCRTEPVPPCTPTHTFSATTPPEGRRRTYSVGGFDGMVSKEAADMLKDAPLARNSFPMVHEGFQDAYSEIRKELFELLLPVLQRQLAKSVDFESSPSLAAARTAASEPLVLPKIYCTGHSLGGSLAQLFALDLATNCEIVLPVHNGPSQHVHVHMQSQSQSQWPSSPPPDGSRKTSSSSPPPPFGNPRDPLGGRFFPKSPAPSIRPPRELRLQPPIGVYTYGQPRVGNRAFSRFYKLRVPHSFRVVNEGDAFTTIPNYFWCGGLYKHAGLEVILDAGMTGNVLVGPTVVETLFRFHKVRTNVLAHQMERYRECLECILDAGQLLEYSRNHNMDHEALRQIFGSRSRSGSGDKDKTPRRRERDKDNDNDNVNDNDNDCVYYYERRSGGGADRNDGPDWQHEDHSYQQGLWGGISRSDGLEWHQQEQEQDDPWKQAGASETDAAKTNWYS